MPASLVLQGLGFVVSAAVGGVIEGKADDRFRSVQRALRERLPALLDQPEGLDLVRGMRRAQFRALDRLVRDFQEVGPHPPLTNLSSPDPFFERALTFCAESLRSISTYIPRPAGEPTADAPQLASLTLAPADNAAEAVEHVEDAVLAELRAALDGVPLSAAFEAHFRDGGRGRRRYVDVFGMYVAEEIKDDEAFREVLNARLHLQTLAAVQDAGELAERILREFGPALSRIEDNVGTLVQTTDAIRATQSVHDAKLDEILRFLSNEKGIPIAPLQKILERLGELNVAPEHITERLDAWAGEYVDLRAKWSQVEESTPDVAAVKAEALALIEAADFDGARRLFAEAREKIRGARQDRAREEAALLAAEAEVDRLELRYRDAVERYTEAASLVSGFDPVATVEYQWGQASTLQQLGKEFGDNPALLDAIAEWKEVARATSRDAKSDLWMAAQINLGSALQELGERESETTRLEESVTVYQTVMEHRTREQAPLKWAAAQNNLGNALLKLGERERGTARLEEAVTAYRTALEERTRERVPLDWAMTQNNLGNALLSLGERESGTIRLKEAVTAYRAALQEYTRERVPLGWATIQNNLGAVLQTLGLRESGTGWLEEAAIAYRTALEVRTRNRVPLNWATTQNNLGNALYELGSRESGTERLKEAVTAFRAALEEYSRERAPLNWAMTQNNLGVALQALGDRENGTARLEEAVAAFKVALEAFVAAEAGYYVSGTQQNLVTAQEMLEKQRNFVK